ncbi:RNA polymerase sigma factor [Roseateles sp. NT4]|uniref:RNA polymerase sigma factor n=1 Tax=Roseateles sp. NT4 TaxID=3453715 RepID=UPI003EED0178
MPDGQVNPAAAAEQAARRSYGRLVAFLSARSRDVAGAEDALADAFETALARWPLDGVPDNPDAWLLTVARRKTADALRERRRGDEAAAWLEWLAELETPPEAHALPDRRLELMFACAHPAIDAAARAPLMLQAVLGFDAATIAAAFLVAPAAMSQRLVRAKAKIRQAGIGLQVPARDELAERLGAVLSAIYAVYADAWTDATGTDPRRRDLADEAICLARLVASLLPQEPEALGLLALMLYSHARRAARRDVDGVYVPLTMQDPARWEGQLIREAEGLLHLASSHGRMGRYQLEAALQSAHVQGRRSGRVDWPAIERLYAALCELTGSPVAALNHAVALSHTTDATAALAALDTLHAALSDYQPYWAARAELLGRCGREAQAREACGRAVALESDEAVREFLRRRAAAWGSQ